MGSYSVLICAIMERVRKFIEKQYPGFKVAKIDHDSMISYDCSLNERYSLDSQYKITNLAMKFNVMAEQPAGPQRIYCAVRIFDEELHIFDAKHEVKAINA